MIYYFSLSYKAFSAASVQLVIIGTVSVIILACTVEVRSLHTLMLESLKPVFQPLHK
jgi:hypothetical protein